jgi:hypothetical protein
VDTLVNKLSHVVKNNGKKITRMVKELLDEGYILAQRETAEYIKTVLKI